MLALGVPLAGLADLTATGTLAIFIAVHLALIVIKRREAAPPPDVFVCPGIVPVCGALASAVLLIVDVPSRFPTGRPTTPGATCRAPPATATSTGRGAPMPYDPIVFKICSLGEWAAAEVAGRFAGSAVDRKDGFIHFSSAAQVRETAAKHFRGLEELVLVAVDADQLGEKLVWEPSRGGDLFPHLYGELPVAAVLWVKPLVLGSDGVHRFPDLTP